LLDGEPTGKSFRVATVAIFTFEGELITNERVYLDLATLLRQIGRDDLLQPSS
jgi:ketosteroid isomerase-like protein